MADESVPKLLTLTAHRVKGTWRIRVQSSAFESFVTDAHAATGRDMRAVSYLTKSYQGAGSPYIVADGFEDAPTHRYRRAGLGDPLTSLSLDYLAEHIVTLLAHEHITTGLTLILAGYRPIAVTEMRDVLRTAAEAARELWQQKVTPAQITITVAYPAMPAEVVSHA